MLFKPNIAFSSLIKINGRLREFNFRKRGDETWETDASDDRGVRYYFLLQKGDEGWAFNNRNIPEWILANQEAIINAILEK